VTAAGPSVTLICIQRATDGSMGSWRRASGTAATRPCGRPYRHEAQAAHVESSSAAMPWRQVGRGRYFYRCQRVAGRPRQVHFGTGPAAELAAAADDLRRVERAVARSERRAEQAGWQEAEAPLLELCELTDVLARAALTAAGYHQHDRGPWRHRREPEPTN
jgi:hypothetical protein